MFISRVINAIRDIFAMSIRPSVRLNWMNEWKKLNRKVKKCKNFLYFFELAIVDLISWLINAVFAINAIAIYMFTFRVWLVTFFSLSLLVFSITSSYPYLRWLVGESPLDDANFNYDCIFRLTSYCCYRTPITPSR